MEQTDYKKQYDQTLNQYTAKRSKCSQMEKDIPMLKQQINALKNKLNQLLPEIQTVNQNSSLQLQIKSLIQLKIQYETLSAQLKKQQDENIRAASSFQRILQQHHRTLSELQQKSHSTIFTINNAEKEQASKNLELVKHKAESEQARINQLKRQIEAEQLVLLNLQRQVQQLKKSKDKHSSSATAVPADKNLEEELKLLEAQQAGISSELCNKVKARSQLAQKSENQTKQKQNQLDQFRGENIQLLNQYQKINTQISSLKRSDQNEKLEKELKDLTQAQRQLNKEIDSFNKEVSTKKQQQQQKKQEVKKQKNKDKRNFKQEIVQEHKLTQLLEKQVEREKNKLEDTVKLRKTYVSNENLQILQKQFQRHQIKNKPSLQTEQAKKQKLLKEKNIIQERIDFLKKSTKALESQSEKALRELRAKGDQLVKDKLASEKVLNETTYKLNEYLKEFPHHQKKKQEAKNQEKRRRQQAKLKAKDEQRVRDQQKREVAQSQKQETLEDPNKTEWQKWDEWDKGNNLPKRDQTSLFNNKQFQLIAAAVAIILILTLSFS